jgi:hypothetical protein
MILILCYDKKKRVLDGQVNKQSESNQGGCLFVYIGFKLDSQNYDDSVVSPR